MLKLKPKYLFSAVVAMDDTLPIEIYELIIGAIRDICSSVQDYKNVCSRSTRRGRSQIPIPEEQLEYLLHMRFSSQS